MSRTVVDLQDDLVQKARKLTGVTTKVALVNLALRNLIEQKEVEEILTLKGKGPWKGNLRKMRRNRFGFGR